jgi:exonuclease III
MQHNDKKKTAMPRTVETPRVVIGLATGEERTLDGRRCGDDACCLKPSLGEEQTEGRSHHLSENLSILSKKKKHKKLMKIGAWNVRSMKQLGKLHMVIKEAERLHLDMIGLSETRWAGEGHFESEGSQIIHSGNEKGSNGVAIILLKDASKSLVSYNPISDRMLVIRLNAKPAPMVIIQVYAPTTTHTEAEIDEFYTQLQAVKDTLKKREVCIIMGDFNAKVGEGLDTERGIGSYGLGERNEAGEKLAEFCEINHMMLTNTYFSHHKRRIYTWISPGDRFRNQIDYVAINKERFTSVLDSRAVPGADCDTDHALVVTKIRIKTYRVNKCENISPIRFEVQRLQTRDIK